ncbi:MCE family protein [Williamsia serinedens]|uniref:Phospholipid/cholesterol/gamma-HCH transport system substrate-binding protein n=1 Tax=Williamsia serinedens TaxID=391736 RepID=A0ABT1H3B4_9NOCA|nr:MCE family protein [Williamsia serinedens]MCP2161730.1 phospholipid/cholesterol/gamma-HCH transport system substrate-binding protein [Williamsia serinedens]
MATGHSMLARRLAAVLLVAAIVGAVTLSVMQFFDAFRSTVPVTLTADRAGLVMNPDAKVRLRGVTIGRVAKISPDGDHVVLHLDVDSDELSRVPADVTAQIRSNTIFGAKSVDLSVPQNSSGPNLRAGASIAADRVQVELNTVFGRLVDVLAKLQPEKLNATLGAVDTALHGRGEQIGQGLADLSTTVGALNPALDSLNADFRDTATVTNVYADSFADIARALDNVTTTGNTLLDNASALDALLVNTTGLANTVNSIVGPKKQTLIGALTNLDPVSQMLGYQAPGVSCFLKTAAGVLPKALPIFGDKTGYISLNAGLLPGKEPYRYPEDLPKVNAQGPPTCAYGLSDFNDPAHPPFYVTDNAAQPYQPRFTAKLNPEKLFQIMFGSAARG